MKHLAHRRALRALLLAAAVGGLALAAGGPASAQVSSEQNPRVNVDEAKRRAIESAKARAKGIASEKAKQRKAEIDEVKKLEEELKAQEGADAGAAAAAPKGPPKPRPTTIVEESEKHELREAMFDRLVELARQHKIEGLESRVTSMRAKEQRRHALVVKRLAAARLGAPAAQKQEAR